MELAEGLAWLLLLALLLRIISKLQDIHGLLFPSAKRPPSLLALPLVLAYKASLTLYGAVFLVLSKDKVSSKALKKAPDPADLRDSAVDAEVRIIFVRHGESQWNKVFNRGFGPSFLWRLVTTVLYELYLIPFQDSAFIDSPLSDRGYEQCDGLRNFLGKPQPGLEPKAQADFAALTSGEGSTLLVSSQLRRAVATVVLALSERLQRSRETVMLHSSCQARVAVGSGQWAEARAAAAVLAAPGRVRGRASPHAAFHT